MSDKFGDSDFKEFMNREFKNDPLALIVETIKIKMGAIIDIYSKSLDVYQNLKEGDPLRDELKEHIKFLMTQTLQTIDQFNYALINDVEDDEEEPDGN